MAYDNTNNLPVKVDGYEAVIGTDIFVSAGETAHSQVMKVAWGDDLTVTRATVDTPLPVKVYGLTGALSTVTVTGAVRGLGTFTVGNTSGSPIYVTGGINAFVYGVTGASPVTVTGSVSISSNVGITGVVNVTGGRYLTSANDTVNVTGSVGRSWNMTKALDNIAVYGSDGGTAIYAKIAGSDGTLIGVSGNALNVNVIGAGISATVTIGTTVGVGNAAGTILKVEGDPSGTALPISGTVALAANSQINLTNNPLFIDARPTGLTFADNSLFPVTANNIEKLVSYYDGNNAYSIPWFLKKIKDDIIYENTTGSMAQRLNQLVTDGSNDRTASYKGVKTFHTTKNSIKTWTVNLNGTTNVLLDPSAKSMSINHGVTIKNISGFDIKLGAGFYDANVSTSDWTPPTLDSHYGIYLANGESIFIPNSIFISEYIQAGIPPLYGRFVSNTSSVTNALAIMAV